MAEKVQPTDKGTPSAKWLNLLLAVLVTFFLIYLGMPLIQGEWTVAVDYAAFYAAAKLINEGKFSDIYDLESLEGIERELLASNGGQVDADFEVKAILYLPIFIFPFCLLAMMDFPISLLVWLGINIIALVGYLWFFIKKIAGKVFPWKFLLILLVSYPVLQNFHYGQVNVWMVICLGEFLRAILSKKFYLAGIWLGGLLIKPHLLILGLLFLLFQRKFKTLLGFAVSVIGLTGLSFVLIGTDGLMGLMEGVREAAGGGVSSSPMYMMNWRMLSSYLSYFTNPIIGWTFLGLASFVTAAIPLIIFRKNREINSPEFGVGLLGIVAATMLVAYHAHLHTAIILIPILLYLLAKGWVDQKLVVFWVAIPYGVNLLIYLIGGLILSNLLPLGFGIIIEIGFGSGMLIANLLLLVWAVRWKLKEDQRPEKIASTTEIS